MSFALKILQEAVRRGASDVFLTVSHPPFVRLQGTISNLFAKAEPLSQDDIFKALTVLGLPKENIDTALQTEFGRFRVNVHRHMGHLSCCFRPIAQQVKNVSELGIPQSVVAALMKHRGLILCTGPTGCGKSTTMAALVQHVLNERPVRVVTIEDPVEYILGSGQGQVLQRTVGEDVPSFAEGLRQAVRQNPDIILLGEIRDGDTAETALMAANTGHMVMSTLHTASAAQTLNRLLSLVPEDRLKSSQDLLASCFEAIVSQVLVPSNEGKLVLAAEVLLASDGARSMVREGRSTIIQGQVIVSNRHLGMQSLDQALAELVRDGKVALPDALEHCRDAAELQTYIKQGLDVTTERRAVNRRAIDKAGILDQSFSREQVDTIY